MLMCNEVLDSQNDEHVEKMNDSQTGVIRETVKVEKDMNDVNYKVNEEVEGTDMATESDNSRNSQNADSHKDNDEGKKISYAKIVNNSSLDNKLNLIPTEVNDDGIEVVIFEEDIVNEGSKKNRKQGVGTIEGGNCKGDGNKEKGDLLKGLK
ncbi:hypothetical protein Tco_1096983 [Tanacetum coccineum]